MRVVTESTETELDAQKAARRAILAANHYMQLWHEEFEAACRSVQVCLLCQSALAQTTGSSFFFSFLDSETGETAGFSDRGTLEQPLKNIRLRLLRVCLRVIRRFRAER